MAELHFDFIEYWDRITAEMLAEGEFGRAIEALESDEPIGPHLRETLAAMLRGNGPGGMRLVPRRNSGETGAPRRSRANFKRMIVLGEMVEDKLCSNRRLSKTGACKRVAQEYRGPEGQSVGAKTVENAYREYQVAKYGK